MTENNSLGLINDRAPLPSAVDREMLIAKVLRLEHNLFAGDGTLGGVILLL
jgi:hypothetical protein